MNEAPDRSNAQPARGRSVFLVGILLFAAWVTGLVALVLTSSNPVTLNVRQLMSADSVVVAELEDAATGEFTLVETVAGNEPPGTFRVLRFEEIPSPETNRWLMALAEERAGNFSVVPIPYRDKELLLVYPGTDEVVADAREILKPE